MERKKVVFDGNEAAAYSAYKVNEVISIYPITPASPMAELADQWTVEKKPNVWGTVPRVSEMQSEAGAAAAVHGSLQAGALATTFTASQGLLLMIPNMFKIAGELNPTVFHIAARTVATHALSIFGDHSDVMAARSTGFALLASDSVQEVADFALIAQAAALKSRIPFLHFFDGFRTSHEISKIEVLSDDEMLKLIEGNLLEEHRKRALSPDNPFIRGTAQNPDTFFQARERVNRFYQACPGIVQEVMDKFKAISSREYKLFQYHGSPNAERIIILMGSGAEAVQETADYLNDMEEKVGLIKVRLYRPFSVDFFAKALPPTVKSIAVLDRTKEPGSNGEPLYQDIVNAIEKIESRKSMNLKNKPKIIGGRYGLSSKEFTPAMVKSIYDELEREKPKEYFTIGINDDMTNLSLEFDPDFSVSGQGRTEAVFFGLGSDGTVSANKNSIKIIGEETDLYAQGYFVYDSKKAGAQTVSHLRFGNKPINSPYLIDKADFIGCHQFRFLEKFDVLDKAKKGATFLLNSPYGPEEVWEKLPRTVQEHIIYKKLNFQVIDAYSIAKDIGLGVRINTIMQTCFFALTGIFPIEDAIEAIKNFIGKTYGKMGESVLKMNFDAVDRAFVNLHKVEVPEKVTSDFDILPAVPDEAPEFVRKVTAKMIRGEGDKLPVSVFTPDGTFPSGTTKWEKRNIAREIPVWDPGVCIQCGKCVMVCPHSVIRSKSYPSGLLSDAPSAFKSIDAKFKQFEDFKFTVQVSPDDCTGCGLCVEECPAKNKEQPKRKAINMEEQAPIREQENENWRFFLALPEADRDKLRFDIVREVQLLEPLFEFSGACAGCGETPYLKLLSQLFGDRSIIANSTGCSSIYGGNLPTTPWAFNKEGRGPAWSNSLFEDTAEFGFGMRLALDKHIEYAEELLRILAKDIGEKLISEIKNASQSTEGDIRKQRNRINKLKKKLRGMDKPEAKILLSIADVLVRKNVWIVGGDGWAYDIGYGGLDHIFAMGRDVNILVLDSEVYSNTGGQTSKATPMGAVAKFSAGGKQTPKKDLAMMAMTYGSVYVARVAMGADDRQVLKAFLEAESYQGTSIIIAYSHCIAHGYDLSKGMKQQKLAVKSGYWPLIRYDPRLKDVGKNPLQLDSGEPEIQLEDYVYNETRYKMLYRSNPSAAKELLKKAQNEVRERWRWYEYWSKMPFNGKSGEE